MRSLFENFAQDKKTIDYGSFVSRILDEDYKPEVGSSDLALMLS